MQMGAVSTSPYDDDDDDELEVIMRRPCLHAPKLISLLEAIGMAQSALRLVQQVFQWEWHDLGVEQWCFKEGTPC
jgi:hypothetical protein